MNEINRIKQLVNELNQACNAYYNENKSIMENREYNTLFDELKLLENNTGIILSNSPTQRAGYKVVDSNLPKVKHDIPLLSLDKIKDIKELVKWLGNKEGVLMLKMDGGTGKVEYKELIQRLSTRGGSDTNKGEDISHNINSIGNIPQKISINNDTQITGEMYMNFDDFNRVNDKITDENKKYSNPRNLATATVGISDSRICKERNIKFKAFNIIKGIDFKTKVEQLEWLKSQGFDVVDYWIVNKDNLEQKIEEIQNNMPSLPYPVDGLVLSYNDLEYGLSLGKTNHHFKHSISFKFEDSWYETKYDYTEWNTTRTGQIVPIGIFQKVSIEGSEVGRASLSNITIFENLKLGKGDTIEVSKRNLIIPKIENNITRSNTEQIPNRCPICNGEVEIRQDKDSKVLYCLNPDCEAKFINKLSHFVSKQCFNIIGLSKQSLIQLCENNLINDVIDIFKLKTKKNEILKLDGWKITSYNNLIAAIEKSKNIKIENFITALQINKIGLGKAKDIVKFLNLNDKEDILNLVGISVQELIKRKDFGEKTNENIVSYFNNKDNIELLNKLLDYIEFKEPTITETNKSGIFTNKKIYCTGAFNSYKKNELKKIVEDLGGTFANGYAKSLDYLVVGSIKGSSKEDKAKKDCVTIISEDEFIKMIKEG